MEIKKRPAAAMTKRPAQAPKHESKEEEEGEEEDSEQEEGEGKATEEKEGEEEEEEEEAREEEEERAEEVKEEEGAEEHEEEKDEGGEEATEATEGNKDAAVAKRYGVMYYKNGNCVGIRQIFYSKSQVMNFGGKHCGKIAKELRAIAAQVVRNLEEGLMSESSAKAWAREQVSS